jgi:hypothetical protein
MKKEGTGEQQKEKQRVGFPVYFHDGRNPN